MVEALCYKLGGPGNDSRRGQRIFSMYLILPAAPDINTRNRKIIMFLESKVWPVRRADNLANNCELIVYIFTLLYRHNFTFLSVANVTLLL
jgi:hypothetical protein